MTEDDRQYWDKRYATLGRNDSNRNDSNRNDINRDAINRVRPPGAFANQAEAFPTKGTALVLACGSGVGSVWLAKRGMRVVGVDVSPVAVDMATELATRSGVAERCRFDVFDLDDGLPELPLFDLILCNMFYSQGLPAAIIKRLSPGGLVAMAALSEVGAKPGRFAVQPGELTRGFTGLDVIASGEGDGRAWIMARTKILDTSE